MRLFRRKKKSEEPIVDKPAFSEIKEKPPLPAQPKAPKKKPSKKFVGIGPAIMQEVKSKVSEIKKERDLLKKTIEELEDKYEDALNRLGVIEGKCNAIESAFKSFKDDLMSDFLGEARAALKKEMSIQTDAISANNSKILRLEDDLIKLTKEIDDQKYLSVFNDYYQQVKGLIFLITNCEPTDHRLITLALQTIRSIVDDMRINGYWETGRDAIITSLLNLKSYWRGKDERIENLIGVEINALESLR